jgi:YegS/Rv2252/BmrU family lipid kinase
VTNDASLPREAVLIVNAKSRRGQKMFRRSCRRLEAGGIRLLSRHALRDPSKLDECVEQAVASGAPMVIVGGGDGSLSGSVDHLVGKECVFAVLPLGTANSFARTLGIPLEIDEAVDAIIHGRRARIDLGMIDGDYFANCAAIGLSPLIAETVPHGLKKRLGRIGYLGWAAVQLSRFKPFKLTVGEGADAVTMDATEVRIANGNYHGGTELVDDASVQSGEIVIQVVTGRSRTGLLWSWASSMMRFEARKRTTREFHGTSLRIATDPPLPISIDGEVLARTPVNAKVARRVIEVAVPQDSPARRR